MAKGKEFVFGVGLVFITTLTWLVSSCIQSVTNTGTVSYPSTATATVLPNITTTAETSAPAEPIPAETTTALVPNNPTRVVVTPAATTPAPAVTTPTLENPTPHPLDYNVDINTYAISIIGAVNNPFTINYADIQAYPSVTDNAEIICPDTEDEWDEWTGVPVSTLLEQAGLTPAAGEVVFTGVDGYYTVIPLNKVLQDGTFLAYKMNGEPLTQGRGYPVRLVVKGSLGNFWMRYVVKIEVRAVSAAFSNSSGIFLSSYSSAPPTGNILCGCILARVITPAL
jgi:DMSO/TMAO reductase YedYZ molybdopterin-dependent catalytic subunit